MISYNCELKMFGISIQTKKKDQIDFINQILS